MSELILAVDTSHEFGSLALLRGEELLEEVLLHSREGFGHVLYDHLGRLLERHGVGVDEVACFAAGSGPGSFTGVRVALACVKGLAEAERKPAAGISNLRALAWFGSAPLRATVLDARRGEIYGAVYAADGALARAEVVAKFPEWLAGLPAGEIEFISPDFTPFQSALADTRFAAARVTQAPRALAGAIGKIAWGMYQEGKAGDPAGMDANYVRRSDAELFWKDK